MKYVNKVCVLSLKFLFKKFLDLTFKRKLVVNSANAKIKFKLNTIDAKINDSFNCINY